MDLPQDSWFAVQRAREFNLQTRHLQTYDSHRHQIMTLIEAAADSVRRSQAPSSASWLPRLIVLGAGNCLDLDLRRLTCGFQSICLLDLDRTSLEYGVKSQLSLPRSEAPSDSCLSVQLVAPFDIAAPLASLRESDFTSDKDITRLVWELTDTFTSLPVESADVVASTCLLSQIIGTLACLASDSHPHFLVLLQALRRGHSRRMLQLMKSGGHGLFVTDLVSSETTPSLQDCADAELPTILAQCLASSNFFSGLNPGVVLQDFRNCEEIASVVADVQILPPWRWRMGPRTYAVYAIRFRRR